MRFSQTTMRKKFTYSNVLATLSMCVALGGTAYAAGLTGADIVNGSITNRDLKRGTVQGNKIRNGTITLADIARSVVPPSMVFESKARSGGEAGQVEVPDDYAVVTTLTVPVGNYLLIAKAVFNNENALSTAEVDCRLRADANVLDEAHEGLNTDPNDDERTTLMTSTLQASAQTLVVFDCKDFGLDVMVHDVRLEATKVASIESASI